ncbi:MAG: DNA-binding protein [Lentisphaerae bacterium GWF2_44_16]|nr:MAG: DNA-binding protein [Lentisphaerae bacterium GWF2_44_16]
MKTSLTETDIARKILILKGEKVILDRDLAELYGVPVKRLNEQVKRNTERFPGDFMFQLNNKELAILRSQNETSSWGGSRYLPYAFTEHGALMAATILNSEKAIQMSVFIIRTFVKMREMIVENKNFAEKLDRLEKRMDKNDENVEVMFTAIRQLMASPETPSKKKIGFTNKLKEIS